MDEFPTAVEKSRSTGSNGQARKMPLDILRELFHGGITMLRLRADCLHHNGIEIASQATSQLFGLNSTYFSNQLRCDYGSRAAIGRYLFVNPADYHTRLPRF